MTLEIVTIGAFGFTEDEFFQTLQDAQVDTFCDVRQRRGVRGAQYAFVNSKRLQARLAELTIHYLHRKDLAPTTAVRQQQHSADKAARIPKRQRSTLSPQFTTAYQAEILSQFDPKSLLADLPPDTRILALFCVEREPAACHRSLIAQNLHETLGLDVTHLLPK